MGKLELALSTPVHSAYVLTDHPQVIHKSYAPMGKGIEIKTDPFENRSIVVMQA